MKKVFSVIAAAVVSVAFAGSVANAQSNNSIVITGTGPGSNNTVTYNNVSNVAYTCNNNILALTFNNQDGTSGNATVDFNTNAAAAVSGAVSNTNVTSTNIAAVCAQATTPVASPTPTPSPSPSTTPVPSTPKTLPNTSSNSALTIVIASLAAAAGIVVASRLAVAAYRRIGTK